MRGGEFAARLLERQGSESEAPTRRDEVRLADAELLSEIFFEGTWCHRRVVTFRFVAERRGHWTFHADFTIPGRSLEVATLVSENEVLIPLLTAPKDIMPRADVSTSDEHDHGIPLAGTHAGRTVACMILLWLADQAGLWEDAVDHDPGLVPELTDTDTRVSARALDKVEDLLEGKHAPTDWRETRPVSYGPVESQRSSLVDFANAARLFSRSVPVLAAFPKQAAHRESRKLATISYDGPIRWTKERGREFFGYEPRRIAPFTVFGGDAASYHVQLDPPEGVVVVDTRLLYSYTSRLAITLPSTTGDADFPDGILCLPAYGAERPADKDENLESDLDDYTLARARPLPSSSAAGGWRRHWGFVLGSAEPMPAHVRVGGLRLPRLIDGRDVITMFHVYPDMSAFVGLRVAAFVNFGYVLGIFATVVAGAGSHLGMKDHPEPVFLLGILIAGFGSGLALFRREHILTAAVVAPWRVLFALEVLAVVGSMIALVPSIGQETLLTFTKAGVVAMFGLGALALFALCLISHRAEVAQRAGMNPIKRKQGYYLRGIRFARRRVPDVVHPNSLRARPEALDDAVGTERTMATMRVLAHKYLGEVNRRRLFNEGIPPASRHEPRARGSSGGENVSSF
jgi:hypothetical protein